MIAIALPLLAWGSVFVIAFIVWILVKLDERHADKPPDPHDHTTSK